MADRREIPDQVSLFEPIGQVHSSQGFRAMLGNWREKGGEDIGDKDKMPDGREDVPRRYREPDSLLCHRDAG